MSRYVKFLFYAQFHTTQHSDVIMTGIKVRNSKAKALASYVPAGMGSHMSDRLRAIT